MKEEPVEGLLSSALRLVRSESDHDDDLEYWTFTCGADFDPKSLVGSKLHFKGSNRLEPDSKDRHWQTAANSKESDVIYVSSGTDSKSFTALETSGSFSMTRVLPGVDDDEDDEENNSVNPEILARRRVKGHRLRVKSLPQRHGFFGLAYKEVLENYAKVTAASKKSQKSKKRRRPDESFVEQTPVVEVSSPPRKKKK